VNEQIEEINIPSNPDAGTKTLVHKVENHRDGRGEDSPKAESVKDAKSDPGACRRAADRQSVGTVNHGNSGCEDKN
jgi:hypothetical protein